MRLDEDVDIGADGVAHGSHERKDQAPLCCVEDAVVRSERIELQRPVAERRDLRRPLGKEPRLARALYQPFA